MVSRWTKADAALVSSTKRRFNEFQRWISYAVWSRWLLGFLFWEGTGDLPYTPWRTLSETGWDFEEQYPGEKINLDAFLLGLAVHIRDRDTLESSVDWAYRNLDAFDEFIAQHK